MDIKCNIQKEAMVEDCKKLKKLFEHNLDKGTDLWIVWMQIIFIQTYFIQQIQLWNQKEESNENMKLKLNEIKRKEDELKKFLEKISIFQQIKPFWEVVDI